MIKITNDQPSADVYPQILRWKIEVLDRIDQWWMITDSDTDEFDTLIKWCRNAEITLYVNHRDSVLWTDERGAELIKLRWT